MSTTMAGTGVATGWSRHRLLTALLVVSFVLNVFFIGGAIWTRLHPPPEWPNPTQRFRELAAGLNLEPQQRAGFDHYAAAMHQRTEKMHQEVGPLIGAAWAEIEKPQADEAQIMRLFDQAAEKRREFQRDVTVETLIFMSMLTPAQRDKFVTIARERRPPWARQGTPASPPAH